MKPLIGITGRTFPYGDVAGSPDVLADALLDAVLVDYVNAVIASGGIPLHLPQAVNPVELVGRLDAVVLSGGADIDPAQYGHTPSPDLTPVEADRDEFELEIARVAIETQLPTLGICRGNQVLNVAAGGTLIQHRPEHARYDSPADVEVHVVELDPESIPGSVYGNSVSVNSFHHQVLDEIGDGITVVGRAADGDVEAIQFDDLPIVGLQWHPEMFRRRDPIFDWLVNTASTRTANV